MNFAEAKKSGQSRGCRIHRFRAFDFLNKRRTDYSRVGQSAEQRNVSRE